MTQSWSFCSFSVHFSGIKQSGSILSCTIYPMICHYKFLFQTKKISEKLNLATGCRIIKLKYAYMS